MRDTVGYNITADRAHKLRSLFSSTYCLLSTVSAVPTVLCLYTCFSSTYCPLSTVSAVPTVLCLQFQQYLLSSVYSFSSTFCPLSTVSAVPTVLCLKFQQYILSSVYSFSSTFCPLFVYMFQQYLLSSVYIFNSTYCPVRISPSYCTKRTAQPLAALLVLSKFLLSTGRL